MQKYIRLKFPSWLILVVMLTVTINGVHGSAHTEQGALVTKSTVTSTTQFVAINDCPCVPCDQHNDYDDCSKCVSCPCHAPLTVQLFRLRHIPVVTEIHLFTPFSSLPEVYLSLFVPPDSTLV